MNYEITVDKNGLYWIGDQRMLVSYMRGDYRPIKNPVRSRFEPDYIVDFFPGPVGVVVAFFDDDQIKIGFSKANIWRGDRFDKGLGVTVAVERAFLKNIQQPFEDHTIQTDICDALNNMYHRACNYFKYALKD